MSKQGERQAHPAQIRGHDIKVMEQDGVASITVDGMPMSFAAGYKLERPPGSGQAIFTVQLMVKKLNINDLVVIPPPGTAVAGA
jgi:hypothetical protein